MGLGTAVVGSKTKLQEVASQTQPYPGGMTVGHVGPPFGHLSALGLALHGETMSQYSQRSKATLKTVPFSAHA